MLSKLFGSKAVIKSGIEAIDAVFFTDEERANRHERLLALYEPFKLAQRLLACIFGIPYAIAWLATFIASFFVSVEPQIALLDGDISRIVGTIVGFYFAGGVVNSVVSARGTK